MTIFEEIPALSPVQFFSLSWDCPYLKGALRPQSDYRLPSVSDLCAEESFANVYMGWNEEKLSFEIEVQERTEEDSVELFIDTRDLKTKSHVSKFCHHFVFTPDEREGFFGRETTRFSGDDVHRLCDSDDLSADVESDAKSYTLKIRIPAECLYGFDPIQFPRMGFTYRINRAKAPPQHFAVLSEEFSIEQHPALWATVKFMGRK